jgi:hypothetical protein
MCGNTEDSMDAYNDAIQIYGDIIDVCAKKIEEDEEVQHNVSSGESVAKRVLNLLAKCKKGGELHIQLESVSNSYSASLANLGVLYKHAATEEKQPDEAKKKSSSAMEREQLLMRAEEALEDAYALRRTLLGALTVVSFGRECADLWFSICRRRPQGHAAHSLSAWRRVAIAKARHKGIRSDVCRAGDRARAARREVVPSLFLS